MIKPELYMRDDTIYFVIPDDTKPIKVTSAGTSALVDRGDKSESIEENPFL